MEPARNDVIKSPLSRYHPLLSMSLPSDSRDEQPTFPIFKIPIFKRDRKRERKKRGKNGVTLTQRERSFETNNFFLFFIAVPFRSLQPLSSKNTTLEKEKEKKRDISVSLPQRCLRIGNPHHSYNFPRYNTQI